MAKTKAQNTRNQQNHRDRVKAKFEAVIADILDDVVVYPERKDDGKLYITWDMSPETHAKLTLVAEAKGTNLDAILGGLVKHRLKLQELKEKHDGGQVMENPVKQLITVRELTERLGVSRGTLGRWCKRPDFPKPVRIGPNSLRWQAVDVQAWIDAQSAWPDHGDSN